MAVRSLALGLVLTVACAGPAVATAPTPAGTLRTIAPTPPRTPSFQSFAPPTDAAGQAMAVVWMGEHYFSPSPLTVPVGTTVIWWVVGQQEHDVWAYDGSFRSPTMGPGNTFTHTFTTAGTFRYLCVPHGGDGMTGMVIVTPRG